MGGVACFGGAQELGKRALLIPLQGKKSIDFVHLFKIKPDKVVSFLVPALHQVLTAGGVLPSVPIYARPTDTSSPLDLNNSQRRQKP